jgi:membrane protease subunit HflC
LRKPFTIAVAAVFVLVLLLSTVTYTVRFTEKAVLTTFGRAADGIQQTPGLKLKWPYPVQSVIKYDTRLRAVFAAKQQQQTADNRQLVIEAFAAWRVSDPLKFYESFSNSGSRAVDHFSAAEQLVRSSLGGALSAVSRFRMDELFTADAKGSKLPDLDTLVLKALNTAGGSEDSLARYGIEAVHVGISQIRLPESTSRSVFERMTADRDKIIEGIESTGTATAETIRSRATAQAQAIESFVKQRAAEIRVLGDQEAAPILEQLNEKPELAVFLNNIELLRTATGRRVTLVLDQSVPGVPLFSPASTAALTGSELPPFQIPSSFARPLAGEGGPAVAPASPGATLESGGR